MTARNPFESDARNAKARALIRYVDREVSRSPLLRRAQIDIAAFLREQSDEWWLELAKAAGVRTAIEKDKAPSKDTRAIVWLEYAARAEELAHAVDGAFDRLDDMAVDERWER